MIKAVTMEVRKILHIITGAGCAKEIFFRAKKDVQDTKSEEMKLISTIPKQAIKIQNIKGTLLPYRTAFTFILGRVIKKYPRREKSFATAIDRHSSS
ncbi:MAG: hypothetical protein U0T81_13555 [Saprospiraceae bacterium]